MTQSNYPLGTIEEDIDAQFGDEVEEETNGEE